MILSLHVQDAAHFVRGGDDPQIGFGGAVGSAGALFPIAQGFPTRSGTATKTGVASARGAAESSADQAPAASVPGWHGLCVSPWQQLRGPCPASRFPYPISRIPHPRDSPRAPARRAAKCALLNRL